MNGFLKSIRIQGFRCLRDVTLDLGPMTVLVGPNASGKSAILAALDPNRELRHGDLWEDKPGFVTYTIQQHNSNPTVHQRGYGHASAAQLKTFQRIQLDPQRLRDQVVLAESTRLALDGSNIANVFYTLTRIEQAELSKRFCAIAPTYQDVGSRTHAQTIAGHHEIEFMDRWRRDSWYRPQQVSDGTLLLLALMLLPYQKEQIDIIGIEEPEHGIHPYLIEKIVGMLRALSKGELGPRPIQVILTTHSPTLLQFVKPEEAIFLRRSKTDGSTEVRKAPTDDPTWADAFDAYDQDLGSIWLSGNLGGVPGSF